MANLMSSQQKTVNKQKYYCPWVGMLTHMLAKNITNNQYMPCYFYGLPSQEWPFQLKTQYTICCNPEVNIHPVYTTKSDLLKTFVHTHGYVLNFR